MVVTGLTLSMNARLVNSGEARQAKVRYWARR
jgi:hypothetical protein